MRNILLFDISTHHHCLLLPYVAIWQLYYPYCRACHCQCRQYCQCLKDLSYFLFHHLHLFPWRKISSVSGWNKQQDLLMKNGDSLLFFLPALHSPRSILKNGLKGRYEFESKKSIDFCNKILHIFLTICKSILNMILRNWQFMKSNSK